MNGHREGPEDIAMQQYPSPSVESHEDSGGGSSLFQSGGIPASAAPEAQQVQQLQTQTHSQPQSTESTESPASQDQQQPHTQQSNPSSNAEELQLAAQLSQDLSSLSVLPPGEDATPAAPQPSSNHQVQPEQPATNSESQIPVSQPDQPQLPVRNSHEHLSQQQQFQPAQSMHQAQQASQMQHVQPAPAPFQPTQIQVQPVPQMHIPVTPRAHPHGAQSSTQSQHPQPSQYAQDHHQPVLAPQMNPLDAHQLAAQYAAVTGAVDNTPPRKRSKVSRACDECRRKKVKCDAQSEAGDEQCSNCRRSSIQCLFSRVPQKRGPSKGYIKELADRINHIEGKLGSGAVRELIGGIVPPGAEAALAHSSLESNDRKRPYTSISSDTVTQLASWTPERPMQAFESARLQQSYHPDTLGTAASLGRPDVTEPKPTVEDVVAVEHPGMARDVDENSFLRYLSTIHPYLPFLPSTKASLVAQLARAPPVISQAFIDAFHLAMGVLTAPTPDLSAVLREIVEWEISRGKPTSAPDLIHVQTLLLAAIAAENAGPHPESPLTATSFIRKATDVIFSTHGSKPFFQQAYESQGNEAGPDNEHALWTRTWRSLIIIDRFSSIAWASPIAIPTDYAVLLPSHKLVLGETAYYLAGLADNLGNMSPLIHLSADAWRLTHASVSIVRSTGTLLVDSWRQSLPESITPMTHPFVHIVYWHTKTISYITACAPPFNDPSKAHHLLWCVSNLLQSLTRSPQLPAPFMHHFASLASLVIGELSKVQELRSDATDLASRLLEGNIAVGAWADSIHNLAEHAKETASNPLTAAAQSTASQSLQHLADLATTGIAATEDKLEVSMDDAPTSGTTGDTIGGQFNPFSAIESGYLNVVVSLTPEAPPAE